MTILLEINSCRDCPHFKRGSSYSLDGFDRGEDWSCQKANKFISQFVEWHEENKIKIPSWCPIAVNEIVEPAQVCYPSEFKSFQYIK